MTLRVSMSDYDRFFFISWCIVMYIEELGSKETPPPASNLSALPTSEPVVQNPVNLNSRWI